MGSTSEAERETGAGVLFVGGAMRSGTTLAARLLTSSGETNPLLAESQYLGAQLDLAAQWHGQFDLFLADYFEDAAAFDAFSRESCTRFLAVVRARYPRARKLALKHPETTRHFRRLAEWFPDARFVITVRDPRDTIASMVAVGERLAAKGERGSLAAFGRDMAKFCDVFRGYYADTFRDMGLFEGRMLILRYEDLVANHNDVIGELARFADLRIDPARLGDAAFWEKQSNWSRQRGSDYAGAFWSPDWIGAMTEAPVGRYRERLRAAEIAEIERRCADFAKLFRYW
ncbi:MAG: sulfotransferase [Dongiaceae bacterium]